MKLLYFRKYYYYYYLLFEDNIIIHYLEKLYSTRYCATSIHNLHEGCIAETSDSTSLRILVGIR